jgi:cell division protein FtsN
MPEQPQEYIFKAPSDNATPASNSDQGDASQRYLVYVNGNSPYLLQQVQQIEPTAFMQGFRGQQVIQIGVFETESNARQKSGMLSQQGIGAEVAAIAINRSSFRSGTNFVVIVPANQNDFSSLTEQIVRLGIRQEAIQPKMAPVAPHLQIGPFADRQDAEKTSRSLRREGLDARVFYNR